MKPFPDLSLSQQAFVIVQLLVLAGGAGGWLVALKRRNFSLWLPGPSTLAPWPTSLPEFLALPALALCLGAGLQTIVLILAGQQPNVSPENNVVLLAGLAFQGGLVLAAIVYRYLPVAQPGDATGTPGGSIATALGSLLLAMPAIIIASEAWEALLDVFGVPSQPQELIDVIRETTEPWSLAGWFLLVVIIAPIAEELLFRRGIFRYLTGIIGPWSAAAASALLFAAFHFNAFSFLPLFALGLALALAYRRSGSTLTPIVMHMLFNLNTFVMLRTGLDQAS